MVSEMCIRDSHQTDHDDSEPHPDRPENHLGITQELRPQNLVQDEGRVEHVNDQPGEPGIHLGTENLGTPESSSHHHEEVDRNDCHQDLRKIAHEAEGNRKEANSKPIERRSRKILLLYPHEVVAQPDLPSLRGEVVEFLREEPRAQDIGCLALGPVPVGRHDKGTDFVRQHLSLIHI